MSQEINDSEDKRAHRICFRTNACSQAVTNIYEHLVDREFTQAEKQAREIIREMKLIIKSIPHDDF